MLPGDSTSSDYLHLGIMGFSDDLYVVIISENVKKALKMPTFTEPWSIWVAVTHAWQIIFSLNFSHRSLLRPPATIWTPVVLLDYMFCFITSHILVFQFKFI